MKERINTLIDNLAAESFSLEMKFITERDKENMEGYNYFFGQWMALQNVIVSLKRMRPL